MISMLPLAVSEGRFGVPLEVRTTPIGEELISVGGCDDAFDLGLSVAALRSCTCVGVGAWSCMANCLGW